MEPKKPQNAQIIFGNAAGRIANKAYTPRRDVGEAVDIIMDGAVARHREGVHRKIASLGVAPPIAPEGDFGAAAISLNIFAERRHLEWAPLSNDGDGAVFKSSRHPFESR